MIFKAARRRSCPAVTSKTTRRFIWPSVSTSATTKVAMSHMLASSVCKSIWTNMRASANSCVLSKIAKKPSLRKEISKLTYGCTQESDLTNVMRPIAPWVLPLRAAWMTTLPKCTPNKNRQNQWNIISLSPSSSNLLQNNSMLPLKILPILIILCNKNNNNPWWVTNLQVKLLTSLKMWFKNPHSAWKLTYKLRIN